MPTEVYVVVAFIALAIVVGAVALVARGPRGPACPRCRARLPRDAAHCPNCGQQVPAPGGTVHAEAAPAPAAAVELTATAGPLAGQRFPIRAQVLTIGRHPDNDIVLANEMTVSRQHAVVTLEEGDYVLYDRDSANGTWVNGQRVFRHVLTPGDRIQIWRSEFAFGLAGVTPPPPPVAPARAPAVQIQGEYFDGYRLESLIGRGGMSEVFRALAPDGQTVAIKILSETNPYLVSKFVQEGNEIGPLLRGHPNIVFVYKFGRSEDGRLYLVMEFVDGPSLRKAMRRPLTSAQITSIVGQTCSALAFAHQKNIVHRDVKPENILITDQNVVKVLDFGIAKLTSAATVTTDKIVGTPEYISPEQARGNPVGPGSDVYSLGVVLYELLTGTVPFRRPANADPYRAAMEVVRQHLKEQPEPIRRRNPNAPVTARLERVTMRALQKNVRDRYETARDMGAALGWSDMPAVAIAPSRVADARLVIVQGPRQGQQIPLTDQSLTLGRFDLDAANTTISRRHVDIIYRGGSYWLLNRSQNGTWVDHQKVYDELPLHAGAMIAISNTVLKFEMRN